MKNFKILLLAVFLFSISMSLNAQTTVGLRGGVTLANYNQDPFSTFMTNQEMTYMVGVDAAVFANINVIQLLSIQPEFHYVQKGVKIKGTNTAGDMDASSTYRYDYLEFPVLARLNFGDVEAGGIALNVYAGPGISYALSGQFKGENYSDESGIKSGTFKHDITWKEEYGNEGWKDNRWDLNATGGVGAEFLVGSARLLLDARYTMDFLDARIYENSAPDSYEKIYNRGFSFTTGIVLPFGTKIAN